MALEKSALSSHLVRDRRLDDKERLSSKSWAGHSDLHLEADRPAKKGECHTLFEAAKTNADGKSTHSARPFPLSPLLKRGSR